LFFGYGFFGYGFFGYGFFGYGLMFRFSILWCSSLSGTLGRRRMGRHAR